MKRDKNIVSLSKEHHFGLLCCWKVRQGIKMEVVYERIKNYIRYFWEHHLHAHFKEEEHVLLNYSADAYIQRIKQEHVEIEKLVQQLESSKDPDMLANFADLLDQHIRFEEREWFPYLEKTLDAGTFKKIGLELERIHVAKEDIYKDEFWK